MVLNPTYEELIQRVKDLENSRVEYERIGARAYMKDNRYRTLFEAANDSIFILEDYRFVECNKMTLEMYGCAEEDIVGSYPWDFSPPLQPDGSISREKAIEMMDAALRDKPQTFYWRHTKKDGGEFDAEISLNYLEIEGSKYLQAIVRDITERRKAELDLQESEARFRNLVESSPMGIHMYKLESDGRLIFVGANPAADHILGVKNEQFVGKNIEEAFPPLVNTDVPIRYKMACETGESWWAEQIDYRDDKIRGAFEVHAFQTSPGVMAAMFLDITERKQAEAAIRESEEKHRVLFETMIQGVVYQDAEGNIIDANPSAEKILGLSLDQMRGRTSIDPRWRSIHEDGSDFPGETHPSMEALRSGEKIDNVIMGVFNPSIEDYTWININAVPQFRNGEKQPYQVYTTFQDITERKKTVEALRESEQRFELALETANLGIWDHNLITGEAVRCERIAEIYGYPLSKIEKSIDWWKSRIHPDDRSRVLNIREEHFTSKTSQFEVEYRLLHKSGEWKWIWSIGKVVSWDKDGSPKRIIGTLLDITERKQADETLRQEEEKFIVLVEESPFGISYISNDGHYKYLNPKFIEIFGYTIEDIPTGENWFEKAFPDKKYRQQVFSAWMRDLKEFSIGESRPRTFSVTCKDGTVKGIAFKPVTMKNGDQFVIYEDVTQQRQVEDQLRQSQKMEAIGTLAGGIAHDFNNILSPLLGHAELIMSDLSDDSPFQVSVNEIYRASLRARDLVQQILAFSRQTENELKPIKIQQAVKEAVKLLEASLPKTIDIEQDIDPDCGAVIAAPTQIHQISMNLATNAYHAMEDAGGTLKIILKQIQMESDQPEPMRLAPGAYACLTVSDTGSGIGKDILDRIFDPYFTTKKGNKGTGLGLSVVHGIVKNFGGDIRILTEPGKGTDVHVYLPVIESKIEERAKDSVESIQGGTGMILLVDDEEAIVRTEKLMLEKLGYGVTARTGSIDALEAFKANPDQYDLIISDMTMPNMTGIQLAREIKRIRPEIPVIICTGFSEQIDEKKYKEMGIQGFVMKPIVMQQIADTIREVLEKKD